MTIKLCFIAISAIFLIFSGGVTAPVGLFGETRTINLVLSLIFFQLYLALKKNYFFHK